MTWIRTIPMEEADEPLRKAMEAQRALPPDALQGIVQLSQGIGTLILYGIPVPFNLDFGRGFNAKSGVNTPPGQSAIRATGFVVNPTIKTQYSESWFLNVQREVWKGWIVEAGYNGTRGVNLERIDDVNRLRAICSTANLTASIRTSGRCCS